MMWFYLVKAYSRPLLGLTIASNLVPSFFKKYFHSKWLKIENIECDWYRSAYIENPPYTLNIYMLHLVTWNSKYKTNVNNWQKWNLFSGFKRTKRSIFKSTQKNAAVRPMSRIDPVRQANNFPIVFNKFFGFIWKTFWMMK